jgi:gas vesicle protein
MSIHKKLSEIQANLKAPKNQYNSFGKYNYRSCEDILEAAKKLLGDCTLTLSDDIQTAGDRVYVKATATISDGSDSISVSALAREAAAKKGMDDSQITGTASSYARKYALNGLFCIDDTKDADTGVSHQVQQSDPSLSETISNWVNAIRSGSHTVEQAPAELQQQIVTKLNQQ